jgi:competence protein ComEC
LLHHFGFLALALAAWAPKSAAAADLTLRFLDVGQGDAALLSHDGKHVLVDTGGSDRIVKQLSGLGVEALKLLVVSHTTTSTTSVAWTPS